MKNSNLRWIWLSFLIIILDQWTKQLAAQYLVLNHSHEISPFLNLTLVYNYGSAFGFLNHTLSYWQHWLFIIVAAAISIILLAWLGRTKQHEKMLVIGLVCILGGALGNMVDRLLYGFVIDFIDVFVKQWHWPAFNLADSAITIGVILLLLDLCFKKHTS